MYSSTTCASAGVSFVSAVRSAMVIGAERQIRTQVGVRLIAGAVSFARRIEKLHLQISAQGGRSAEQFVDLSPNQQLEGLSLSLVLPEREARAVMPEQQGPKTNGTPPQDTRGHDDARESGREQANDVLRDAPKAPEVREPKAEGA
jgi:hypothetical protein